MFAIMVRLARKMSPLFSLVSYVCMFVSLSRVVIKSSPCWVAATVYVFDGVSNITMEFIISKYLVSTT